MLINKEAELVSEWWPHELRINLFVQLTQVMGSTKIKNKFVYYIVLEGSITYAIHQTYISLVLNFVFVIIYLPHDYNNYKKIPPPPPKKKKCRKKWRGGLKETIELMLIRSQLQFFEDGTKITATDTK